MSEAVIQSRPFVQIDLADPFFDSLKESYAGFSDWFARKAPENAYVSYEDGKLQAFLYLKIEQGQVTDVTPPLNTTQCLKVGTFKINAHGTKLGERFVKIIVDTALNRDLRLAYVTVFPEYEPLIRILETYGFALKGKKEGPSGVEDVYIKDMQYLSGNVLFDYPIVNSKNCSKWLLSIRPEYHTKLFPDSILRTEPSTLIQDTSYTNSIHKVYVGFMRDFSQFKKGNCLVIYRCQAQNSASSAWFKSVATSLCVIEEVRPKSTFSNEQEYIKYCTRFSVFSEEELARTYRTRKSFELHAIKMTYNLAFPKRPNLEILVNEGTVPHPKEGNYMGLLKLEDPSFEKILQLGGVNAGFVIN